MYKKFDIYASINLFLSYSEVTEATRSGPYPAQMVTTVSRCRPYPDQMVDQHLNRQIFYKPLQPRRSAESRTRRRAPETDPQWGPRHIDSHREKTTGTSGALTIWICCSWNKLVCPAGGELVPRLSLVSPKVFSQFCHRWSFGSLPEATLACLVGDSSFPAMSSTWLHRYYLNWTELDNAITKFNNERPSAYNWVLNVVILHYRHYFPILILCSCFVRIGIV